MVANNVVSAEEVGGDQCDAIAWTGAVKGGEVQVHGLATGRLLGPARDEHGIFSICSKNSIDSNFKWSKRCLPLLENFLIKYIFVEN
jgi:hypothetical protein